MDAPVMLSERLAGDRAINAIRIQVRRIVEHSCDWLLSPELYRLAIVLREAANELDQAANERSGVGRRDCSRRVHPFAPVREFGYKCRPRPGAEAMRCDRIVRRSYAVRRSRAP